MTAQTPPTHSGTPQAPVILSNAPGSFAWNVLEKRHPTLIQQVRDTFPYGPQQHRALDALLEEIAVGGAVTPLDSSASDHETWSVWGRDYFGRSWFEVPFLWAESYFY